MHLTNHAEFMTLKLKPLQVDRHLAHIHIFVRDLPLMHYCIAQIGATFKTAYV
jgi:hypothetical protein